MHRYIFYMQSISIATMATFCVILVLKRLSDALGLMDHPGGRKNHLNATPLVGGIAIYIGLCLSLLLLPIASGVFFDMLVGAFLLILIGAADDRFETPPRLRLIVQISALLVLIFIGNHCIHYIGSIFFLPDVHLNKLSIPLTVILGLGFINAINMLDGQDGLAGSIVFTEIILLFLVSAYLNHMAVALILLTFLVLLFIFLCFNAPFPWRRHASVFLGDAGSNFVAFFVVWAVIYLSQVESNVVKPITLIWIVAFPFFDMTSACIIRQREGRSWTTAGHDHIHHSLQRRNVPVFWSTFLISAFSMSLGILGLFLAWEAVSEGVQSILYLVCFIGYLMVAGFLNSAPVPQSESHNKVTNAMA